MANSFIKTSKIWGYCEFRVSLLGTFYKIAVLKHFLTFWKYANLLKYGLSNIYLLGILKSLSAKLFCKTALSSCFSWNFTEKSHNLFSATILDSFSMDNCFSEYLLILENFFLVFKFNGISWIRSQCLFIKSTLPSPLSHCMLLLNQDIFAASIENLLQHKSNLFQKSQLLNLSTDCYTLSLLSWHFVVTK